MNPRHEFVMKLFHVLLARCDFELQSQVYSGDKGSIFMARDRRDGKEYKIKMEAVGPSPEIVKVFESAVGVKPKNRIIKYK